MKLLSSGILIMYEILSEMVMSISPLYVSSQWSLLHRRDWCLHWEYSKGQHQSLLGLRH